MKKNEKSSHFFPVQASSVHIGNEMHVRYVNVQGQSFQRLLCMIYEARHTYLRFLQIKKKRTRGKNVLLLEGKKSDYSIGSYRRFSIR